MSKLQNPPPPGTIWFSVRSLREQFRAVAMNADGFYVGYTGSGPRSLGWRRRTASTFDLVPMDIPGDGFGSEPYAIDDDGTIVGESSHPQGVTRPYLWTPTRGNVTIAGLNSTYAPLTAVETRGGVRLMAGNHGNRAYVVVGDAITQLPLPDRATASAAHAVRLLDWEDNRGIHHDQVVAGSVTYFDGPLPALWYRDEGSPTWPVSLTQGRFGMSGALRQSTNRNGANFIARISQTVVDGAQTVVRAVLYTAVGHSMVGGKKRATAYWYIRDDQSLNGSRLPLLAPGQESVAHAEIRSRSARTFIFGQSGGRAVVWESGHGSGGATRYSPNADTEGFLAYDLNGRANLPTQTVLTEALAISKTGQVLCNGTQGGAPWTFLLEPNAAGRTRLNL